MTTKESDMDTLRSTVRMLEDPESQAMTHISHPGDLRRDPLAVSFRKQLLNHQHPTNSSHVG